MASRQQIKAARMELAKRRKAASMISPPFFRIIPLYAHSLLDLAFKYLLFTGGRGGGKSFSIVCFLIEQSFKKELSNSLFIFAREIQTSISESVYALCKSMIGQAFLSQYFIIQSHKIINKITGVEFVFIGLRATGGKTAFSQMNKIKGKFNVKYIFVDEAQDLSEDTINVLFPTVNRGSSVAIIPKDWHEEPEQVNLADSRLLFAMNPNFDTDPIVLKIQGLIDSCNNNNRAVNAIMKHINIFDLPVEFQDKQLIEQANQEKNEIYYDHVWLGAPHHKISGYPWAALEEVRVSVKISAMYAFLDPSFKGGDYTAISFLAIHDGKLCVWGYAYKQAWNVCLDKIVSACKRHGVGGGHGTGRLYYEDNSLGTVPEDKLAEYGLIGIGHCTSGNKESRIYKTASYVADRTYLIANYCNTSFIQQTKKYNEEAENDDAPDSLASVILKAGIITDKIKF